MTLRFVWVGKTKRPPMRELIDFYLDRVRKFARVEISELRDCDDVGGDRRKVVEREGEAVLAQVAADPFVVLMDERGQTMDSFHLANFVEKAMVAGTKKMTFVLGGHSGVSDAVRRRADITLALSAMTLTHEMARLLLAEQVYRAFTIIQHLPYPK